MVKLTIDAAFEEAFQGNLSLVERAVSLLSNALV